MRAGIDWSTKTYSNNGVRFCLLCVSQRCLPYEIAGLGYAQTCPYEDYNANNIFNFDW